MSSTVSVEVLYEKPLVEHRLEELRRPLEERLTLLLGLARKVAGVHGGKDPRLAEIPEVLDELVPQLRAQAECEKRQLLPALAPDASEESLQEALAASAEADREIAASFEELHRLTGGYEVPAFACQTLRRLFENLVGLERLHTSARVEREQLAARTRA